MIPYAYIVLHKSVQRRQVQDATVFALTHRSDNSFSMSIPYERLALITRPKNMILSRWVCFPLHIPRISYTSRQGEGRVVIAGISENSLSEVRCGVLMMVNILL